MGRPKKKKDLIESTASGDRLETLIALRDLLAEKLQHTASSRDISAMSRRLMQCISEIELLEERKKAYEERQFSLSELRKHMFSQIETVQKKYEPNSIASEHEKF